MAETPTPVPTPKSSASAEALDTARGVADAGARSAKDSFKAAEAVGDKSLEAAKNAGVAATKTAEVIREKTAEATEAAAKANSDILRTQVETAQSAMRSGIEASVRSFEGMTQTWSRSFGLGGSGAELVETSSRNLKAVSQASTALAKGAQDASRTWVDLTQKTVRANMDAMTQIAQARTLPELIVVHSNLVRGNLEQAIAAGEEIARVSGDAIREATRAIQPEA
jgi:hypothetical protein